jgi:hypothetical protein
LVIRAIKAVAVIAATEATSSAVKVISANTRHATASDVTSTEAAHVAFTKASDVTSAEAAHVASAKAATHVASATAAVSTATAAAGLCTAGKQAAGKHRACQNHHHSSSHDILHSDRRTLRHRPGQTLECPRKENATVAMNLEVGMLIFRLY